MTASPARSSKPIVVHDDNAARGEVSSSDGCSSVDSPDASEESIGMPKREDGSKVKKRKIGSPVTVEAGVSPISRDETVARQVARRCVYKGAGGADHFSRCLQR